MFGWLWDGNKNVSVLCKLFVAAEGLILFEFYTLEFHLELEKVLATLISGVQPPTHCRL